jgi:hypothetical protein
MPLYSSIADRLKSQHLALEPLISNSDQTRLNYNPAPGKWSVIDNIAHLATYQPIFLDRVRLILNENEPSFTRYVADNDPEFESCRKLPVVELINSLKSGREAITKVIFSLTETELQHCGLHPKFGRLSIIDWVEFFLLHEAHHFFTIYRIVHDIDLEKASMK